MAVSQNYFQRQKRSRRRPDSIWQPLCIAWFLLAIIILQCSESVLSLSSFQDSVSTFAKVRRIHRQVHNDIDSNDNSNNNDNCPHQCICVDKKQNTVKSTFTTVTCSSLNLTSVPQGIPSTAKRLDLSENNFTWIGPLFFPGLNNLQELSLKSNLIDEVDSSAFNNLAELKELTLARNQLKQFPTEALQSQQALVLLNLDFNQIRKLEANLFQKPSKLVDLLLGHNLIEDIDGEAFNSLPQLRLLELNDNKLSQVPNALIKLPNLEKLTVANNRIVSIDLPFYKRIPKIILLEIRGNPLQWIHPEGFTHLQHLKKLILSNVRNLTEFPHLNGTYSLEILRIDRCSLHSIPNDICSLTPKLKSLDLKSNKIHQMPHLNDCHTLRILDLSSNFIQDLGDGVPLASLSSLHVLHLAQNRVNRINAESFYGLGQLQTLDLSYNNIQHIHPEAFVPLTKLEDLNLGNNFFSQLPSIGLDSIIHLKTFNNPNLREFPGPESFPHVRTMVLSYAYHCCQFNAKSLSVFNGGHSGESSMENSGLQEDVLYPTDNGFDSALLNLNLTDLWPGIENFSDRGILAQDFINNFAGEAPAATTTGFEDLETGIFNTRVNHNVHRAIQCIPQPGPFLPCNDLFDWWTLRCGVWIVFLLALMGNGTVVFVLIFSRTKLDVPRFLVCNLAIADFFMGIYLGFLAVVDAATLGEFRKFAIPWQFSSGCQMAGFFGVLSSELSVYTLAVITMERHYAITHAMHLNKRLSLRHASYIMLIGWTFSLIMAILPLFGISDYRKFAVCLPFETSDKLSLSYVVFLMFANGVAFTILMGCYLKMYCSIRGSQAWNSNDTRIAKRMALLVFTDLLCWFPIAFFSLTAIFGLQLVSLEEAKVFTVFILPFNSCCNPFLYAILTKQFKKDCVLICKAIEESRVTRGIGRCRNSSNFSNRQTAPNTGSLMEKSSRDGQPCICHSGLHPVGGGDVNGNAKYRFLPTPERCGRFGPLGRFVSRFIFCQNANKDSRQARDDYRMRNVRRYLYTTANVTNFPTDAEKHQRHPSVSSDNFSSSRSDSWRPQGRCGIPLRRLEPRRRNSWAVTRKPSQDSSLSNSRNDSSTTNSTATWRLSRSSVSSDATNHSGGGKSSLKKTSTIVGLPNPLLQQQQQLEESNLAGSNTNALVHSPILHSKMEAIATGTTISTAGNSNKRPKTLQFNDDAIQVVQMPIVAPNNQKRNSLTKSSEETNFPKCSNNNHTKLAKAVGVGKSTKTKRKNSDSNSSSVIIEDDELSAKIATNRPRLVRQSAFFSDEVVIEPEICPVHGSLIGGTYDDENDDDDGGLVSDIDEGEEDDDEMDPSSPILRKVSGQSAGDQAPNVAMASAASFNPYNIALAIVSRRLSTISSRDTVSLQSKDDSSNSSSGNISIPQPANNSTMIPMDTFRSAATRKMSDQCLVHKPPAASSTTDDSAKLGAEAAVVKWHSASEIGPALSEIQAGTDCKDNLQNGSQNSSIL